MKKNYNSLLFILMLTFSFYVKSQNLNQFIKYDQKYLKISISEDGIYKLSYEDLLKANFIDASKSPKNIQLYYRGTQMAIAFVGQENGTFGAGDYLYFYAKKNDGLFDGEVYKPKNSKPHNNFNLYTDETSYFLTYGKEQGLRANNSIFKNVPLPAEKFYLGKTIINYNEDWNFDHLKGFYPELQQSFFESNEVYCSRQYVMNAGNSLGIFRDSLKLNNINFDDKLNNEVEVEVFFNSRQSRDKELTLQVGNITTFHTLSGFNFGKWKGKIANQTSSLIPVSMFINKSEGSALPSNNAFSISYLLAKYRKSFIFENNSTMDLNENNTNISRVELSNSSPSITILDITDFNSQIKIASIFDKNLTTFEVNNTKKRRTLFLSNDFKKPLKLELKSYENIDFNKVNYLIITHKKLLLGANKYKEYRNSKAGGNYNTKVIDIYDIYDEYLYGEKNPIAIKKFVNANLKNKELKPLLFLGRGLSYTSYAQKYDSLSLVPGMGFPTSDFLMVANEDKDDKEGLAYIGRVSAMNNEQVIDYLEKVKEYEANNAIKDNVWRKQNLQLSGGKGEYELIEFKKILTDFGKAIENSKVGSSYSIISKASANETVEEVDISKNINKGVGMVTFFGHAELRRTDLNIGFVSNNKAAFNNSPRYPFMLFNGCGVGNVFGITNSLSNDWLITPKKGAIGILAHSFLSYASINQAYMQNLFNLWFNNKNNVNKSVGEVLYLVTKKILTENKDYDQLNSYEIANVHQMVLQGDPAVRIFNFDKPDLETNDDALFLKGDKTGKTIAKSDSLQLGIGITNLGIYEKGTKVSYTVKKNYIDNTTKSQNYIIDAVANQDTAFVRLKREANLKSIQVIMDSDQKIEEMEESNNAGAMILNWAQIDNLKLYSTAAAPDYIGPILNVTFDGRIPTDTMVVANSPILKITLEDNNSLGKKTDNLIVNYREICDKCPTKVTKLEIPNITGDPNQIIANIALTSFKPGTYEIYIQGFDAKNNASGQVYSFTFTIKENIETKIKVYPNPLSLYTIFEVPIYDNDGKQPVTYSLSILNSTGSSIYQTNGTLQDRVNTIMWDAKNNEGNPQQPGLYFYKMVLDRNGKKEELVGKLLIKQ